MDRLRTSVEWELVESTFFDFIMKHDRCDDVDGLNATD